MIDGYMNFEPKSKYQTPQDPVKGVEELRQALHHKTTPSEQFDDVPADTLLQMPPELAAKYTSMVHFFAYKLFKVCIDSGNEGLAYSVMTDPHYLGSLGIRIKYAEGAEYEGKPLTERHCIVNTYSWEIPLAVTRVMDTFMKEQHSCKTAPKIKEISFGLAVEDDDGSTTFVEFFDSDLHSAPFDLSMMPPV